MAKRRKPVRKSARKSARKLPKGTPWSPPKAWLKTVTRKLRGRVSTPIKVAAKRWATMSPVARKRVLAYIKKHPRARKVSAGALKPWSRNKNVVGPSVKCNPISAVGWGKTRKLTRKTVRGYKRRMGLKNPRYGIRVGKPLPIHYPKGTRRRGVAIPKPSRGYKRYMGLKNPCGGAAMYKPRRNRKNPGAAWHTREAREWGKIRRTHLKKATPRPVHARMEGMAFAHAQSAAMSRKLGLKNPRGSRRRKLPAYRKNPLLSIINPPVRGIPIAKFRNPEFVKEYNKACRLYKQQHGCWPTKAKRVVIPIGSKRITDSTVMAYVGHAPTETYVSRVRSRKGRGQPYEHKYANMPKKVTDGGGRIYLTLPGRHRMRKGWITG